MQIDKLNICNIRCKNSSMFTLMTPFITAILLHIHIWGESHACNVNQHFVDYYSLYFSTVDAIRIFL